MVIQARMGSSRLPGKSMLDLAGKPMIYRIIQRVKNCKNIDEIVLAIPNNKDNEILKEIANQLKIKLFCGSEHNLVDRYYHAAIKENAKFVVRLPADNAIPEPQEIDKIIDYHISLARPGFSTNLAQIFNSGYPDGIGAEIFDFCLLEEVWLKDISDEKKEHVHLNFFDYSTGYEVDKSWCPVSTIKCPSIFARPDIVLDVNTRQEYEFIKEIYEYFYKKNSLFHITDIINWYDNIYKKQIRA